MSGKRLFDDIHRIITRKSIPPGQITLYKVLYETHGEWLSKTELAKKMRWNDEQSLQSVLGALGNRVNKTENLNTTMQGIDVILERQRASNELHYRMRPEVREVIDREAKLREAIKLTVDEAHKRFNNEENWLTI